MITRASTSDQVLSALVWYFDQKAPCDVEEINKSDAKYYNVAHVLTQCRCEANFVLAAHPGDYVAEVVFFVPPASIEIAGSEEFAQEIGKALSYLMYENITLFSSISVKVLAPDEVRTIGLNNCYFKTEQTILHDELRFRSRGEIAIYDELKRRDVLFFPNPAAVLGATGTEYGRKIEKREPDFLICYKGKWGILEINSDDFHSGPIKTTKDHERARRFNHYGVFFIQAFDLDKCKRDAEGVVDEFLSLLEKHRA